MKTVSDSRLPVVPDLHVLPKRPITTAGNVTQYAIKKQRPPIFLFSTAQPEGRERRGINIRHHHRC